MGTCGQMNVYSKRSRTQQQSIENVKHMKKEITVHHDHDFNSKEVLMKTNIPGICIGQHAQHSKGVNNRRYCILNHTMARCHLQKRQRKQSRECSTLNQCDLIVIQVPTYER